MGLVWVLSLAVFLAFPLYERRLRTQEKRGGLMVFDFGQRGFPLVAWNLCTLAVATWLVIAGDFAWWLLLRWSLSALVVVLLLSLDLMGSTPTRSIAAAQRASSCCRIPYAGSS